ncbi:MAG: hypothetical protein A2452_09200 [Candidatus Firestonebacteria bacterium RIFOXYC2_FULL_39_67]|nr:MAG: hypothetical protein A2536_01675 [Candidatus Firestonebacteria bacterium RIFOXYD2_FULL_39_29]OGF56886.1 MAG: hypothetical protein A2452_09200 [Candidatus Firestonebacteria bacterium RIFOXYC2_FULL_39_67]OGF57769.1 MAG: hypothetical protein A2497_02925 [Candidatus Firestonebacteria bacterium RifOxyC12_full_39_7]
MKGKMKAAVVRGPYELKVEEMDIPQIDDDSLLLKVHRACICNATDHHIYEGVYIKLNPWLKNPHVAGHESSGEVVEAGKNIKRFKVGDRLSFGCKMGGMDGGAFAEYNRLYPKTLASMDILKDNVSYDEGALLEPLYGVLGSVYSSGIMPGDKVLIIGAGPIGLLHLQVAKNLLAMEIIVADVHEFRLNKAKELGADLIINTDKQDLVETVKKYCIDIDVLIDASGSNDDLIDKGVDMLRANGKYIVYGHAMGQSKFTPQKLTSKGVQMHGIMYNHDKMIPLANKLVSGGRINLKTLITHHVKLDNIVDAIKMCKEKEGEVIKVIVDIC